MASADLNQQELVLSLYWAGYTPKDLTEDKLKSLNLNELYILKKEFCNKCSWLEVVRF